MTQGKQLDNATPSTAASPATMQHSQSIKTAFAKIFPLVKWRLEQKVHHTLQANLVSVQACCPQEFRECIEDAACVFAFEVLSGESSNPQRVEVEISPQLAMLIADRLMGGPADLPAPQARALTAIESRVLKFFLSSIVCGCGQDLGGWSVSRVLDSSPAGQISAAGDTDGKQHVVAIFSATLHDACGRVRVMLPGASVAAGAAEPAGQYVPASAGTIEVTATLAEQQIDAAALENLAVGDIIATDLPDGAEVEVRLAGVPRYQARLGTCDGKRAAHITRRIS